MTSRRTFAVVTCFAAFSCCASAPVRAAEPVAAPSAEVQKRIATVERSLIPVVRIKGRAPNQLAEQMQRLHVPGVSVAVINHGEIEWAKGYGLADIHTKTPVTSETLFQAGSVSKPVAALAALKLVEEGKLNLDGGVNSQLKSWKVPENKFTKQHAVDLRGILSHTAGFTIHGFAGYVVGKPIPTLIQVLDGERPPANSRPVRVDKVPGKGFRYSGGGVTVMQQLVIDVTGRPFPASRPRPGARAIGDDVEYVRTTPPRSLDVARVERPHAAR